MKKMLTGLVLLIAIATTSNTLLSIQDPAADAAREAAQQQRIEQAREELNRRAAEQAAAAQRERDRVQAERNELQRIQHDAEIAKLMEQGRQRKAQENEIKHSALEYDAQELVELSVKFHKEIQKSGAQAVSVSFYSDLDKLEKLVKAIRKNSK